MFTIYNWLIKVKVNRGIYNRMSIVYDNDVKSI